MPQEDRSLNPRGYLFALLSGVLTVALFIGLRIIYPIEPYRCADGWESPSIGIQGACSHHGGVVGGDTMPRLLKIACPLAGLLVFWLVANAYGGFTTRIPSKYGTGYIADRADLIDRAISGGERIEFSYKKSHEIYYTKRLIRPSQIHYIKPGRTTTLCVSGYCFDRKEDRTFLLARMTDVKVAGA
jgi:hypothetical protein